MAITRFGLQILGSTLTSKFGLQIFKNTKVGGVPFEEILDMFSGVRRIFKWGGFSDVTL